MKQVKFYQSMYEMECLQGDTLEIFDIPVIGLDSLDGCSMHLILEDSSLPGAVVLKKACVLSESKTSFQVQLTSEETANLPESCRMHFCLTDANGLKYRKLTGTLTATAIAQGD